VKQITSAAFYSRHGGYGTGGRHSGWYLQGQGQAMGQQLQMWRSANGQRKWLSMLIDAMEEVSRPEVRAVPCDRLVLAAFRAQLARPASASLPYASPYSLRN
jgi:hypothetical protein